MVNYMPDGEERLLKRDLGDLLKNLPPAQMTPEQEEGFMKTLRQRIQAIRDRQQQALETDITLVDSWVPREDLNS